MWQKCFASSSTRRFPRRCCVAGLTPTFFEAKKCVSFFRFSGKNKIIKQSIQEQSRRRIPVGGSLEVNTRSTFNFFVWIKKWGLEADFTRVSTRRTKDFLYREQTPFFT